MNGWVYNGHYWVKETPLAQAQVFVHNDNACSWEVFLTGRRLLADHSWMNWRYKDEGGWKDSWYSWWRLDTSMAMCDLLLSGGVGIRRVSVPGKAYVTLDAYWFFFEPVATVRRVIPNYEADASFIGWVTLPVYDHPSILDHWRSITHYRINPAEADYIAATERTSTAASAFSASEERTSEASGAPLDRV